MIYLEAVVGLITLLFAGDLLVRGSVSLAHTFNLSTMLIGLTVVAFGTSAPELVVGVSAALEGVPTLALGNVVGSNIANVLLVLGFPALLRPIRGASADFRVETWAMLAATVLFIAMCWTGLLDWKFGALLLLLLFAYLAYSARRMKHSPGFDHGDEDDALGRVPSSLGMALAFIAVGLAGLAAGSHLLIEGSVGIAMAYGISEALIGLTLVAIGTSLPELATAIAATYHNHGEVVIGNVVGSNLFNILAVMGATTIAAPVPVPEVFLNFDLWVMLAASLLLLPLAHRKVRIGRRSGAILLSAYGLYMMALVFGLSGMK